jgi:hypothetical protein
MMETACVKALGNILNTKVTRKWLQIEISEVQTTHLRKRGNGCKELLLRLTPEGSQEERAVISCAA